MRALGIGLVAGVGLSLARAPLGVELAQVTATGASTAVAFRAGGLALAALAVLLAAPRVEGAGFGARLVAGLAAGFATHGLLLHWTPPTHRALIGVGLALLFVAFLAGRAGAGAPREREPRPGRPGTAVGLALSGGGLALVLESVARPLRWFGGGLPADDALLASCLLVPAALAALAFVRLCAARGPAEWGRLLGAQGAAVGGLAGLWVLDGFGDPRRLHPHLSRVGIDVSMHGSWSFDVWVAMPAFALAALGIGVLAAGVRRREQWTALLVGAFAATLLLPRLLQPDSPFAEREAFGVARVGALAACLGAVLATWAENQGGRVAWRFAACVPALVIAFAQPLPPLELQRAWSDRPARILWERDVPEGRLAVEVREGAAVALLDGRPLTAEADRAEAERRLLHAAFDARPEGASPRRALVVGALGPARTQALGELGLRSVDRCSPWPVEAETMEQRVHAWANATPPSGACIGVSEARRRLFAGEYDWVYAPPVPGHAARTRQLVLPPETPVAIAFAGSGPAAERALGPEVVPVQTGLVQLDVLALGGPHDEASDALVAAGEPLAAAPPIGRLLRRAGERARHQRERLARRLREANEGALSDLATFALWVQLSNQRRSSPFETPAERVEVDQRTLTAWTAAGLEADPPPLARSALEDLAALLASKRMPERIEEHLVPVADAHWPWPALERAIALGRMELLDPQSALERFGALAEEGAVQGRDRWLLAWIQAAAGRPDAAEASAARAREEGIWAPEWRERYAEALERARIAGPR